MYCCGLYWKILKNDQMPAVVVGMIGMDCIGRVSLLVTCQLIGGVRCLMPDDNCEIIDDKGGV